MQRIGKRCLNDEKVLKLLNFRELRNCTIAMVQIRKYATAISTINYKNLSITLQLKKYYAYEIPH